MRRHNQIADRLRANGHEVLGASITGPIRGCRVRYNVSREDDVMATTMVHVRIDQRVKDKAAKALAAMGMSVSDAVRMLLVRVAAEKALPFDVRVPNATTVKALEAADKGEGKRYSSPEALLKDLGI